MDSLLTAAARSLSTGDPLGALKRIALREDPPALALRGIAMAQLGDFARAKSLLRSAARAFGPKESVSRARCVVAEAEVALASRDLHWPTKSLEAARATLERHGDRVNAAHAAYLGIRRLLLLGRVDEAERAIDTIDPAALPPALVAVHALILAGVAMRRLRTKQARTAIEHARRAALQSRIPALMAEVQAAHAALHAPAARLIERGGERLMLLDEVEQLFSSDAIVVDACRYAVRDARTVVPLAKRPVLFALARTLAEAWPADVSRDALVRRAFGLKRADESLRARLRVEIGRLRKLIGMLTEVHATERGFALVPHSAAQISVLAHPVEEKHAAVLALLGDGESWSSSALSLVLGASQRSVQRALDTLAAAGKVQSLGHGRARRWTTPPLPGFATTLLLPTPFGSD